MDQMLAVLERGSQHRSIRATEANYYSSRAHTIFAVVLEQKTETVLEAENKVRIGWLGSDPASPRALCTAVCLRRRCRAPASFPVRPGTKKKAGGLLAGFVHVAGHHREENIRAEPRRPGWIREAQEDQGAR